MTVLIGGGAGFIGRHLTSMLKSKGYKVKIISRRAANNHITWGEIHKNGIPEGIEAVVNLAGKNIMTRSRFENIKSEVYMSRIDTTRLLAEKIAESANPPKVWLSASGVGFYPVSKTAKYTEHSTVGDTSSYMSNICIDWEQAAKLPENSGIRHVVLRLGLALGRDGGVIQQMYMPFFFGFGGQLADGRQWFPWIHVDDVCGIITHVIGNETVHGVLNAVSPELVTNAQFTKTFAKHLNRPAFFTVPVWLIRSLYGPERAELLVEGQCVIPERTLQSGYRFLYPDLASACVEFCRLAAVY